MKNLFKLSIALLVTAALAACGGSKPMPDETPAVTEPEAEPTSAAAPTGGTTTVKTPDGKAKKTLKKFEGDRMEAMEEDE
ncbi:MAG: hypothetical protein AAFX99_06205 [Myxococcota bacterium]